MAKKVIGPYQVKCFGTGVYEVVSMVNPKTNTYEELNPRRTYIKRQSAYRRAVTLNRRWNDDHMLDDNYDEMVRLFA